MLLYSKYLYFIWVIKNRVSENIYNENWKAIFGKFHVILNIK